ncbi:restriction endonuclease subunit S [Vibrio cholerae]|uniref:restriction endonuclease subunit S n=1 Tax=Vibrio cholerae TaxID=666 RepID=UPI0011DC2AF8|nr:restriction endonuclease subunit S [Vibrio cholerae]TXX54529.1 restriction endonuclease subunit S [Vibrio cholerae]GIB89240.1 type I restriction modification DNA specificity domain protein [Vibrio cholerae]
MSISSYMEKLLDGVEVEWKVLAELGELVRGNGLPKTDFTDTGVPAIHYGQIYTHYGLSTETTLSFVSPETAKKLKKVDTGDVVITNTSENLDDVGKALVYLGEQQAVTGGHATIFKPSKLIIGKYFAYFTQTSTFFSAKRKLAKGTKVIDVSATDMAKIQIPIPCPDNPEKSLAIQAEIVRILDAFTAMTAELTAELNLRKKQYNYYRDQLLSFEEGEVEWKTLGDISDFTYGYAAKAQESGDARFVRITDINTNGKLSPADHMYVDISEENERYLLKKYDLLMARTGATFGKTMIFEEDYPAIYAGFLIKLSLDPNIVNPKYYWHFAQSDLFWDQANKLVSGGGQPQFNANALKQVKLPVPYPSDTAKSLAEQARIVLILDKFDAIASSLSEGLPREIELRQKQYEYYRDLLLSFPQSHSDEAA